MHWTIDKLSLSIDLVVIFCMSLNVLLDPAVCLKGYFNRHKYVWWMDILHASNIKNCKQYGYFNIHVGTNNVTYHENITSRLSQGILHCQILPNTNVYHMTFFPWFYFLICYKSLFWDVFVAVVSVFVKALALI